MIERPFGRSGAHNKYVKLRRAPGLRSRHHGSGARQLTGESRAGTAEIESGLASIFESRAQSARLETLDVSTRFIRPDIALAHVLNELSGLKSPSGETLPAHRELSIRVPVMNDGVWRVTAFHNTIVQPFGSEASPAQR